ncbi:nitrate/nitrite transporter [Pseudonocardia lacus]|uniref:nitrate/nitrite transporter n=1 Tax=Pseudonocardia lacus TaxID=2835865 RepID=UPI0027E2AF2E|nr:nitrate/nitrite transporter [Pseudonocardia lacus]
MPTTAPIDPGTRSEGLVRGRWIDHWEPEDPEFWQRVGAPIARRNLWASIAVEHVGFSVWTLWSVFVLFMGPEYGLDAAAKFLLVSTGSFVGAVLRVPYTFAVARFGGRNWSVISGLLLLVPTVAAAFVLQPGTPYWVFLLMAALAGLGGGNFASSMTNINAFYPDARKGLALGLNAGGGNIGVAVIQLIALLVIAVAGAGQPRIILAVYIPLVVVVSVVAALTMDNITSVRNDTGAARLAMAHRHTAIMSFLYIGTFGSFIGYSFAFGLVLQNQFGRTPLEAAAVTFIGPLIGSLIRPLGGWLADRLGGATVTFWNFIAMALSSLLCIVASGLGSLGLFTAGFICLFVFAGVGNGSTYKMIPAIFRREAQARISEGAEEGPALRHARRISGAALGLISAVGALGGLLINLAFRQSFAAAGSGVPAFWAFLAFYVVCVAVTYAVYVRVAPVRAGAAPRLASVRV